MHGVSVSCSLFSGPIEHSVDSQYVSCGRMQDEASAFLSARAQKARDARFVNIKAMKQSTVNRGLFFGGKE